MSGKENASKELISPTSAALQQAIASGTLTPTSQEDGSQGPANDELSLI